MIATSEFKSDLVNVVYLRHVFEKHFNEPAAYQCDSDKEDQEMMIDKFNIYEQQVQHLLKDIEEREESIGDLDEFI